MVVFMAIWAVFARPSVGVVTLALLVGLLTLSAAGWMAALASSAYR